MDPNSIQTAYYVLSLFGVAGGIVAAYARSLHNKIDRTTADLAAFKTTVATDYPSTHRFETMVDQITEAIGKLGDRIDALFHRAP